MTHNELEGPLTFSCKHQRTALKRCVPSNLRRMAYRISQPSSLEVRSPHCPRSRRQCVQAGWSIFRGGGGRCCDTKEWPVFPNTKFRPRAIELTSQLGTRKGKGRSQSSLTKPRGANFHLIH